MNRTQMNDHLAKVMKQVELNPHMRTEGMYVPNRKTMADMPDEYLRKQLCQRAGRTLAGCVACVASARWASSCWRGGQRREDAQSGWHVCPL